MESFKQLVLLICQLPELLLYAMLAIILLPFAGPVLFLQWLHETVLDWVNQPVFTHEVTIKK